MDNIELEKILQQGEHEKVEFKQSFNDTVVETLVAFANTKGGTVYIGVDNNGKVNGIKLGKETFQKWLNEIKNKTNKTKTSISFKSYR